MRKPNIARLQTLYDFMKTVPKERFDLSSWGLLKLNKYNQNLSSFTNKVDEPDTKVTSNMLKKFKCGTTACLLGWAASIPEFNKKGLTLISEGIRYYGEIELTPVYSNPTKLDRNYYTFHAGEKFFNIDSNTAEYLFDPSTYNDKYQSKYYVLRRLASVIKNNGVTKSRMFNE